MRADLLIAPHGAAIGLCGFMRPGGAVLEVAYPLRKWPAVFMPVALGARLGYYLSFGQKGKHRLVGGASRALSRCCARAWPKSQLTRPRAPWLTPATRALAVAQRPDPSGHHRGLGPSGQGGQADGPLGRPTGPVRNARESPRAEVGVQGESRGRVREASVAGG